jgi:hypothetical protein
LFGRQEKRSGELLWDAVCKGNKKNHNMLFFANSLFLPAVNTKARIKWGTGLIRELFDFFKIPNGDSDPDLPIFFVTLADKFDHKYTAAEDRHRIIRAQAWWSITWIKLYRHDRTSILLQRIRHCGKNDIAVGELAWTFFGLGD